ncbi:pentatricopeptide repeat-containing protein [Dorcoceras hygrometricum]|uniref:Pentatricopeptide repeat-containing protein n=1 Tax=Dorcoceras hygrometricum TaxID=472368 RepID=A0A2Z7CMJ5_9LAMI|nr:pentatricopeptide repeat-containing protein [Dorcoceras hygrometricum]
MLISGQICRGADPDPQHIGGIAEKDSVPARADVVDKEISTADDVDHIIEQVIAETDQFETDVGGTIVGETNFEDQAVQRADEMEHWFNISYEEFVAREADRMVESGSDIDEEIVAAKATGTDTVMGAAYIVDTEDLSLAKDVATMTESEDTGSIPADVMLPSVTAAEITRIKFVPSIEIPGVHEGDWYKASLPQISTTDKGKVPLVEDTIKGLPAREMFSLICADIDFLVQLREKVIADVVSFFHSFCLSKLGDLELVKGIIAKEKQFLAWAQTDSLETAVRRREFTIAKYREMLLRKFLESHRQHFQAGQPSTATDLQIIALLSNAHIFAVETLQTQMRIHGLKWERICSSRLFEGENRDRGAVIAQSNTSIKSLCWLRTKTLVDGSWVIQEGNDLWQRLPKQTVPPTIEYSPQRQFDDTLAPDSLYRGLFNNIRQEIQIQKSALSLDILASRRKLITQQAAIAIGLDDIRKDVDETKAALSNALLEFHAQAQENYNNLSSQLGELVAYINRGNDKKGEESSIRRPQPSPDDQNRPSGGSASRGGGSGGRSRRDDRRGSSTKRGSSSSGGGGSGTAGGPYKKNDEWWLYGKNHF